jgi:histidyl-tRNA synthetase
MATQKPSIPKGTRDFSPQEMIRRNHIFRNIEEVFARYGYQPLETPAMENLSTLLGKYGEEGDRLLFRILNSGDFLRGVDRAELATMEARELALKISEKGLRYDLTVPFARFVVQHRNEITFPFKRYQIQPVWRADRPQKGRYREFYQCDVDVIGSTSLLNEAELVMIIDEVFTRLNVPVVIHLNNRKILMGIAEAIGVPEKMREMTVAIDKLVKIGLEGVKEEMREKGIGMKSIEKILPLLDPNADESDKNLFLSYLRKTSNIGRQGLTELEELESYIQKNQPNQEYIFDLTLARGLDYYTGTIFEVTAKEWTIGSICGGGRYDDLTGIFGLSGVSGVGVSFGADRIYDVMLNTGKFPEDTGRSTTVLFLNFGAEEVSGVLPLVRELRSTGIATELYPDAAKIKKQMSYANNKKIPFVVFIGKDELAAETATLKNMSSGEQVKVPFGELTEKIVSLI